MHSASSQIVPFLFAALVVWSIYRRLRRSFGKQRLRPVQMGIRIGLFLLIGGLLLPSVIHSSVYLTSLESLLGGLLAGVALAVWGASRTRYLREQGQLFYVPHTYTGLAVSLLFLGRLVYRFVQVYSLQSAAQGGAAAATATGTATAGGPNPGLAAASMVSTPLTLGLFYVLLGYYVCYYSVVLWKSKHLTAEELATKPAPLPQ
jgi:hypothetical protein